MSKRELKAVELRIGNLVCITDLAKHDVWETCGLEGLNESSHVVASFDADELNLVIDNSEVEFGYNEVEPIELTEEWLVKLGFNGDSLDAGHNDIVWFNNHVGIKGMLGVVKPVECRYVHQLQNIFYAFTGKELKMSHDRKIQS